MTEYLYFENCKHFQNFSSFVFTVKSPLIPLYIYVSLLFRRLTYRDTQHEIMNMFVTINTIHVHTVYAFYCSCSTRPITLIFFKSIMNIFVPLLDKDVSGHYKEYPVSFLSCLKIWISFIDFFKFVLLQLSLILCRWKTFVTQSVTIQKITTLKNG